MEIGLVIVFNFSFYCVLYIGNDRPKFGLQHYLLKMLMIEMFSLIFSPIFALISVDKFSHDEIPFYIFLIILYLLMISHFIFRITKYKSSIKYDEYILKIREQTKEKLSMSIRDFYEVYSKDNIVGVYALYNKNKNKYYVGRSQNIVSRVKAHLEGRGNAHLFADLEYGDEFLVHLIEYESKFYDTAEQEKYYIQVFDSYRNGYNKTRGG